MQAEPVFSSMSEMVSIIGDAAFSDRFFGIVQRLLGADHCTVFVSHDDGLRTLVAEAGNREAAAHVRHLAGLYRDGGYRADPVWNRAACQSRAGGAFQTEVIAPAYFEDPAYRREYYEKPNILEELALSAEVGAGRRVYASFYRERGRPRFSRDDLGRLQASAPIAMQVLAKHAEVTQRRGQTALPAPRRATREELFARVSAAMMQDNRLLTRREAEICTGIVLGYTILGLSMNLGISVNTVATHRKRAYAKLRISSQNELFAHYFALVESLGGGEIAG